jgi:hypothetical protein
VEFKIFRMEILVNRVRSAYNLFDIEVLTNIGYELFLQYADFCLIFLATQLDHYLNLSHFHSQRIWEIIRKNQFKVVSKYFTILGEPKAEGWAELIASCLG